MSKYIPDFLLFAGLIMLGIGVGLYSVPLALVSVGGLLILLSVFVAKNTAVTNVSE